MSVDGEEPARFCESCGYGWTCVVCGRDDRPARLRVELIDGLYYWRLERGPDALIASSLYREGIPALHAAESSVLRNHDEGAT